jgi:GT2 family glycosyltransferase
MKVAVLIVTFRDTALTIDCVRSVQRSRGVDAIPVVIDNGSGDGCADTLQDALAGVTVLRLERNTGYTGGNNVGLRHAAALGVPYALVLNNDTIVDPDCIARLVAEAERVSDAALLCPRIHYHDPDDILWYGGGVLNLWTGRALHVGRRRPPRAGLPAPCDITFATGCAVLVRMAALPAIGLLDESLFGYAEDTDWSLRTRAAGFRLRYVPDAVLWHREGIGYRRAGGNALRYYLSSRNLLRVMARHIRWYHWPTFLASFVVGFLFYFTALALLHRDLGALRALYVGAWHAVSGGRLAIELPAGASS